MPDSANSPGETWPLLGVRLSPLYPYIEAEARYACRVEYAQTAQDFIARRTRLSFLNAQISLEVLPRVIDIMAEELGWDQKRKASEFYDAVEFLKSMGLHEVSNLQDQGLADQALTSVQASKVKYEDAIKNRGKIGLVGMTQPKDAALYARAQFTPDEVAHLRQQFEALDFVRIFNRLPG